MTPYLLEISIHNVPAADLMHISRCDYCGMSSFHPTPEIAIEVARKHLELHATPGQLANGRKKAKPA